MGVRLRSTAALQVRMNPELALDAKVDAGPLSIRQVHGPIKARVSAGPLKIEEFEGPLDLHVAAGPIKARGTLDHGDSRIQCEAGSVNLHLTHGSSVRVKANATLGKVHLFGERDRDRDRATRTASSTGRTSPGRVWAVCSATCWASWVATTKRRSARARARSRSRCRWAPST